MVFQMSNDVSGTSTGVESDQDQSGQTDSTQNQFVSNIDETTPPKRVPVEVIVNGQDNFDGEATEPDKVVSLDGDPAEEVAMLLGKKKPPVPGSSCSSSNREDDVETETAKVADPVAASPDLVQELESDDRTENPSEDDLLAVETTVPYADELEDPFEAIESNEFMDMGLSPGVMDAIGSAGYQTPSPIQSEAVPYILAGRDLMGQAETGSGKTAAFAWPLLSKIDTALAKPQVLVLAPTRELAIQVTAAFEKYARGMRGFRAVTIYGGQSYETQLRALSRGVQVVVGTPGRVMDHLRRHTLDLRNLKTLVLDEADEMLRMGFIDDVEWILEQIPGERQILSFSATLPPPIQRIAKRYLKDPAHVTIKSETATADSINQFSLFLQPREKMERLVRILQTEEAEGVLVFVKTRNSTVVVAEGLIQRGIIASPLNGDIPQCQRERTVNQLKSGRINVVVATDVAARGLDVERISHVINYDFPHDTEAYVHRIGRTGRAGRSGNAILFVEPKEKGKLSRLQYATNQRIEPFKQKSIEEINKVRIENFKRRVIDATKDKQIKFFTNLISELQNDSEIPFDQIAGALAVLAQGEAPLLLRELGNQKSNWKKDGAQRGGRRERGSMTTYRVEVGREHGVGPGNIVGAVTNEANLNNGDIGRINIFDRFSTIDLPSDLPQDLIDHLKHVYVSGQRLDVSKSDRTYAKSGGRKSGPSHGGGARNGGRKRFGDKKSGDKKWGEKKFSAKKFSDKKSADKKFENKSYGERKPSDGSKDNYSKGRPFENEGRPFEKKTYKKKPFERTQSESNFGDKKSGKRKSNASGQRTERGEKRDRFAREGGHRYKSAGSKFSKPTSKAAPKTKAAERTRAKRKPGAKPSSPMKKYVKIRSAK